MSVQLTIKQLLITLLLSLSLTFSLTTTIFAFVGQITDAQLQQKVKEGVPIIDIRRAEEWKQTGVVKGSHLLTFFDKRGRYNLDKWLSDFNKIVKQDQPLIFICRTGNRTGMLSGYLDRKLGYKNVNHVSKGISSWIKTGNKVVKP